jgi:ferredoxin-NADP reductase
MMTLLVLSRQEVAVDVVSFVLGQADGAALPPWEPGAHIDLLLPSGLERQYSLTGSGLDPAKWEIAVLREPQGRGGSAEIFDGLQQGAEVTVRGPRNHFALVDAPRYRFIAGGIGITPIRAMVHNAQERGSEWKLLYGGRSGPTMAYTAELQGLYGDRVEVRPQDEFGLLDLAAFLDDWTVDTHIYCCGPGPLLDAVEKEVTRWSTSTLHVERFAPVEVDPNVIDTEFEVELTRTGITVTVPVGTSILTAVEDAGAFVTASCEEGTCGSCETIVLDGLIDHRDSVLSADDRAANDAMMICVSRCLSDRLVLDM